MRLELKKRPKNPIIIEGFPGFGLISTIATEYIVNHLNAQQIGRIVFEELPPVVAVHSGQIVEPIGIFYSKKYNLVILHALTSVVGFEWKIAKHIEELFKILKAKEIVCIEGIGGTSDESRVFYISNKDSISKKIKKKTKLEKLKEGIIMGVTGALSLNDKLPIGCFFAETQSNLPDSRAAAKIVKTLDDYLGLKIDTKPLIKKAEVFEKKIKNLITESRNASQIKERKELSYLG